MILPLMTDSRPHPCCFLSLEIPISGRSSAGSVLHNSKAYYNQGNYSPKGPSNPIVCTYGAQKPTKYLYHIGTWTLWVNSKP